jgi:hypothetical protein
VEFFVAAADLGWSFLWRQQIFFGCNKNLNVNPFID